MPSTLDPLLFPEQIFGDDWKTLEREAFDAAIAVELAQARGDQDAERVARDEQNRIRTRMLSLTSQRAATP